jgi:hypothetical protein
MTPTINLLLRGLCLFVYAAAAAHLAGWLPAGSLDRTPLVAGVLLAIHAAELVFMTRQVRLYRGPFAVSVLLTLLFGLLHWKPLADAQARASAQGEP